MALQVHNANRRATQWSQRSSCPRSRRVAVRCHVLARPPTAGQERVAGRTYGEIVQTLADRALAAAEKAGTRHYMIGIAGSPGSGKSTLAQLVCHAINQKVQQQGKGKPSVMVPMDGFHLYRWQLDQMPHPEEAYARRGAHWTFDADAFVNCVRAIRETGAAHVPSFDHGIGDPIHGDIQVTPDHGVVVVEGNYLYLDEEPWLQLREMLDDKWFVDCPIDLAMHRVFERQTALGLDPSVSKARIAGNDEPNGKLVNSTKVVADVLVPSDVPFWEE